MLLDHTRQKNGGSLPSSPLPAVPAATPGKLLSWQAALLRWFAECGRTLPWRSRPSPYAVTVSEFMLQQTRVAAVLPFFERWMGSFPDFSTLAHASEQGVLSHWQGLGYYSRARNLHALAKIVIAEHRGELPPDFATLRSLPGVGDYTAAAIRAFAFDLPDIPMDANIIRVLARWMDYRKPVDTAQGKADLRNAAWQFYPEGISSRAWNSALMELGALLCGSETPACEQCPVRLHCRSQHPEILPQKSPKPALTEVQEARGIFWRGDHLLLERSPGPRWRGLWILPEVFPLPEDPPLAEMVYPITRYKVTMRIFLREYGDALPNNSPTASALLHLENRKSTIDTRKFRPATAETTGEVTPCSTLAQPIPEIPMLAGKEIASFSLQDLSDCPMPSPHRRAVALFQELLHT